MIEKIKSLGPGLLYAGAAIGVSHLVQSTKAGASYGYTLAVAIILAHFFKFPFFALGPRYSAVAGESLVAGFSRLGNWAVIALLGITLSTMFFVQSAVTIVTAGLVQKLIGVDLPSKYIAVGLLLVCIVILQIGKRTFLDKLMRVTMLLLTASTVVAVVLSVRSVSWDVSYFSAFSFVSIADVAVLIALVGWMPAPLDIAVWHSIWSVGSQQNRSEADFDFKIGFYGTAFLGLCFLVLGAHMLYGTGIHVESSASGFASQLIDVFTQNLGQWSYWLILIAALTTMFSTTLTCFDAMPRVMQHIAAHSKGVTSRLSSLVLWQWILCIGTSIILLYFLVNMKQMVNVATTVSFLTAPLLAIMCYLLVQKHNTSHGSLSLWSVNESKLAVAGITVLLLFSGVYIYTLIMSA